MNAVVDIKAVCLLQSEVKDVLTREIGAEGRLKA